MHRAILIAWLPWFVCLLAAVGMLWLVMRFSGARLCPAKLRHIHRCEAGSVQTLSFVLTLPLFIMLLMFIVQVAELMVGISVVHYAAFAAARAAIVWIPAEMPPNEPANAFVEGTVDEDYGRQKYPEWICNRKDFSLSPNLWKYEKIWSAAAIACTPLAPSRDLEQANIPFKVTEPITSSYLALSPSSSNYPRIRQLIAKKLNYARRNTWIAIQGIDRDSVQGPTYIPYPGHYVQGRDSSGNLVDEWVPWNPPELPYWEVGWEDPITITVGHQFALLPGPGRFLSTILRPADGTPDQVSPKVLRSTSEQYKGENGKLRLYYVELYAQVTLSNEGLKSVMPYVQLQSEN